MKATQLFGRILRPTHDFVGWAKTQEGYNHIYKTFKLPHDGMDKAHSFTSLPMNKRWFERGERPKFIMDGVKVDTLSGEDIGRACEIDAKNSEAWENWTPLLEGDWEIINQDSGGFYIKGLIEGNEVNYFVERGEITETLNDFITHCTKQEIELVINPKFEIK